MSTFISLPFRVASECNLARLVLTRKQQSVFDFIRQYFTNHHQSPLIREIQSGCQISSYKSALDRLNALERKGYIRRQPSKHRGIRLARKPPAEAGVSALPLATPATLLERDGEFEGAGEGVVA